MHREQSVKREKTKKMQQSEILLSTTLSTCFGHHYARLQENKDRVTACSVLLCNKREKVDISRNVFIVG